MHTHPTQALIIAAALSVVVVVLWVEWPSKPSLHDLDLAGGSYILWENDGTVEFNGKRISCAQLKAEAPYFFHEARGKPVFFTENCKPVYPLTAEHP